MIKKYMLFAFITMLSFINIAQTGPIVVKNSLTNQGAFINPSFEFTTEFDTEKDSNNANNTVRGVLIKGLNYSKAENTNKETKFFGWLFQIIFLQEKKDLL